MIFDWVQVQNSPDRQQHTSSANWDKLTQVFPISNSSKGQTIRNLNKIYQKFKKGNRNIGGSQDKINEKGS